VTLVTAVAALPINKIIIRVPPNPLVTAHIGQFGHSSVTTHLGHLGHSSVATHPGHLGHSSVATHLGHLGLGPTHIAHLG